MNIEHPFLRWLRKAGVFLACCLGTAVMMRLLMLEFEPVFTLPFALLALLGSSALAWFILRRWRFVAPLRCASELGICAGIGGLGLYILFAYGIAYLFTPHAMPHPHSVYFCMSYAVCLGVINVIALHCIRRFRYPLASFVLGLAALGATFWFAIWLQSGLARAGVADYEMGLPYRHFIRAAFIVFLMFILVRGGYLLRHVFIRRSHNAANEQG